MRVGIPIVIKGDAWQGGNNYFLSLFDVLSEYAPKDVHFFCLTNRSDLFSSDYGPRVSVLQCDLLTESSDRTRRLSRHFKTDIRLAHYARQLKLDLISHALPGERLVPPTLFWMPDFQHCCLPQLFAESELKSRDSNISMVAKRSGNLLLSSHSAASDFRKFYPQYSDVKTHVVQFSPHIKPHDFTLFEQGVVKAMENLKYEDEAYYYLPNQFWVHKNHETVIEALSKVSSKIKVIATGYTKDHRNNRHFDALLDRIESLGLTGRFIVKGLVTRQEVVQLMAGAIAIINPSFFEGWSTTVEEAKAFGKSIILSDIAVHREQNHPNASYFVPSNPGQLACLLTDGFETRQQSLRREFQQREVARNQYRLARQRFAKHYVEALLNLYA